MAAPSTQPAITMTDRFKAYLRTLNGKANVVGFLLCIITAILAVLFILPDLNIMGALGVLTIYIIIYIIFTALARMVLARLLRA